MLVALLGACNKPSESVTPNNAAGTSVVGQVIRFGQGGGSEQYRVSGWSHTEAEFTWTEGRTAKLDLPIGSDTGPWSLKVAIAGLIHPPDLPYQTVEVYANDKKVAEWQAGNTAELTALIPADANQSGGKMMIEFRTPKAASPKSLGLNEDPRVLGVCVLWLELRKAN
jgi:hypothetical protein